MAQRWRIPLRWGAGRLTTWMGLVGLLALLGALAGCALPPLPNSVPAQNCVSQRQGALGAGGGLIIPLSARDPTSADHTSALYAVRASDGALAWSCASTTYAGWDDAQMVNGVLYAIAGTEYSRDAPKTHIHAIYAIRPQDGKQLWSYSFRVGSTSALAFDGSMLFFSSVTADSSNAHSDLYAIHMGDGSLAWMASFSDTLGPPVTIAHHVVAVEGASTGQAVRAFSEGDGSQVWSASLAGSAAPIPLLALNGALYSVNGATVTALNGVNGATRWTQHVPDDISSQLFASAGALIFSTSQSVFSLDATTGALRWSAVLGSGLQPLVATSAAVYVVTRAPDGTTGKVVALSVSNGEALWQRDVSQLAGVATGGGEQVYLTLPTGAQLLTSVFALDPRGGVRWTYNGKSPYSGGLFVAAGDTLYYVWEGADDSSVTRLNVENGAALWTTALSAHGADPLQPLLAP